VEKMGKITEKEGRQNLSDGNFWMLVCLPKTGRQTFLAAPFRLSKFLNTPLVACVLY
jgi:hypothetical protein